MASMFDTLTDSLVGAAGDIFSSGLNLAGQVIIADQNNNAAMDRQQQSQQGATVGIKGSTNKTDATSKETSSTNQNTNISSTEKTQQNTSQNTTQSETEKLLSEILNNKNVDENTKSQLQQMLQGTTNLTAGTAQSNAALNQLLGGMLDPSQYSPEKAQAAATDMMKVASQQIMQSGIGDVLNAGTATGTFGSTAQAQLSNDLTAKAALGATQAGNAVLGQYSEMRNKEIQGILEAIKAAQSGNQSTATNQNQSQVGSTNTQQQTTDKTTSSQDKTGTVVGNTNTATSGTTSSTGSSSTASNTTASGSSSQTGTTIDKEVAASSNQNFDDWIKANMPKS